MLDCRLMLRGWRTGAEQISPAEVVIGGRPRGPGPVGILEILEADSLSSSRQADSFLHPARVLSQAAGELTVQDRLGPVRAPGRQVHRCPEAPARPDHPGPVVPIAGSLILGSAIELLELVFHAVVRAIL